MVGSKSSGIVDRVECKICRRRCAGSGAREKMMRGVASMCRGLIQEVTLSSAGSKDLRREYHH